MKSSRKMVMARHVSTTACPTLSLTRSSSLSRRRPRKTCGGARQHIKWVLPKGISAGCVGAQPLCHGSIAKGLVPTGSWVLSMGRRTS